MGNVRDEIFLFDGSSVENPTAVPELTDLYWDPNAFDQIASPPSTVSPGADSGEDHELFSDLIVNYISDMLMEENIDEKLDGYLLEPSALQATEQSLYEALSSDDSLYGYPSSSSSNNNLVYSFSSQSSFDSPSNGGGAANNLSENFEDSLLSSFDLLPDFAVDTQFAREFRRGVEEARKFLPSDDRLVINLESTEFFSSLNAKNSPIKSEEEDERENVSSRSRKNPYSEESGVDPDDRRSRKQTAVTSDDPVRSEIFDRVLLCNDGNNCKSSQQKQSWSSSEETTATKKTRGKGAQSNKDVVDLRTLLIHCAQAVSADDRRSSADLLKQIKSHASQNGDGNQRLAYYFADGLEARMAGTGSQIYHSKVSKRLPTTEILKAYQLYLCACPFKKTNLSFANRTIIKLAENASRLHIIDFGIHYGFQWPCFMQSISSRPGGPPRLKITGIEVPRPGFRPDEMVEETGRRLEDYARSFSIPFEYHYIAAKWETIKAEDINVEPGELLVINCMYRLHTVADETVNVESPRNAVLETMRKLSPDLFITSVVNGSYSAPFFVTRFREALFHFSTLFDMLETNVERENPQRLCVERELMGRDIVNVIACEGVERVERPETYKQWQVRIQRSGFELQQLNQDLLKQAKTKVKSMYHKDFVVEEDSNWLLQGWKGRIVYGLSVWKPTRVD